MPIKFCGKITKKMVESNRSTIFVFGDNVQRTGRGGLAAICRDQPNCIGVVTKWKPARTANSYFADKDAQTVVPMIHEDFKKIAEKLQQNQLVTVPPGIGKGLAELPDRAPQIYKILWMFIQALIDKYGLVQERQSGDPLF